MKKICFLGIAVLITAMMFGFIACDEGGELNQTPTLVIEMVDVPAGPGREFLMGSPEAGSGSPALTDRQSLVFERPQRTVRLTCFWMSKYPITQAQFQEVMGRNPSYFQDENVPAGVTDPGNLPVDSVSLYDAVEFCNALSVLEGKTPAYNIDITVKDPNNTNDSDNTTWTVTLVPDANGYRLPTEAEWEYACRAGTTTLFSTGNTITTAQANFLEYYNGTTEAGRFSANPLGLYDMHGNVYEWCWDFIASGQSDRYYQYAVDNLLENGIHSNPLGPESGNRRVARGGAWNTPEDSTANSLRSAFRQRSHAQLPSDTLQHREHGFRVVIPNPAGF